MCYSGGALCWSERDRESLARPNKRAKEPKETTGLLIEI